MSWKIGFASVKSFLSPVFKSSLAYMVRIFGENCPSCSNALMKMEKSRLLCRDCGQCRISTSLSKLDPDRLVHYEGVYNDRRYNGSSDMESQMYPPVERIVKNLAEQKEKPFICCEYTHAMGNSCGAMFPV